MMIKVQLFSERFTGRYFKVRDDDLSSKQGSLCTFNLKIFYVCIYLHLFIFVMQLKHNINFLCEFEG